MQMHDALLEWLNKYIYSSSFQKISQFVCRMGFLIQHLFWSLARGRSSKHTGAGRRVVESGRLRAQNLNLADVEEHSWKLQHCNLRLKERNKSSSECCRLHRLCLPWRTRQRPWTPTRRRRSPRSTSRRRCASITSRYENVACSSIAPSINKLCFRARARIRSTSANTPTAPTTWGSWAARKQFRRSPLLPPGEDRRRRPRSAKIFSRFVFALCSPPSDIHNSLKGQGHGWLSLTRLL